MKRTLRYNLVDVFTATPLTGNPLAVFTQGQGLQEEAMQAIAREMNLSETVFFLPPNEGGHAKVRIFTPLQELPFAGHPLLGSAWILAGPMEMNQIRIETGLGLILVDLERQGDRLHFARMQQPLPELANVSQEQELRLALGLSERSESMLPARQAQNGPTHVLIEAASREQLDALRPDHSKVAQLTEAGVLVFVQDGPVCYARYFAPAAGIVEDPATGSAAGPLAALLTLEGRLQSGEDLVIYQGHAMKRPSTLIAAATVDNGKVQRITVGGQAVVVARGEFLF